MSIMSFDIKDYKDIFQWDVSGDYVPDISIPTKVYTELQNRILYALYYLVTPRIKGPMTFGKLKWRGIKQKCNLIYKKHLWGVTILGDGSFLTNYLGIVLKEEGKNTELSYPIIIQRKTLIDLNFTGEKLIGYEFWKQKNKAIIFGIGNKKLDDLVKQIIEEQFYGNNRS